MQSPKSSKRQVRPTPLILTVALSSALLLQACGTLPSAKMPPVPESLRAPCKGPTTAMLKQADNDTYAVGMEYALKACSARGDALVSILDASGVKKKRWPW